MFRYVLISVTALACLSPLAWGQDKAPVRAETLEEIVVIGEKLVTPTKQTTEQVYTGTEITAEGLALPGAKGATSVYEAVNLLPGLHSEGVDPTGLAVEQKSLRVRGVKGMLGSMTVEGVPNYGGNPMGPREYIYDMENMDSLAVYKGAIPASLGTGVGARGGAIELRPRWPQAEPGLDLRVGIGGNAYSRIFGRVDSGRMGPADTAISASASLTNAEKWKGPGDLGPRTNANFMLEQPYREQDALQLWVNYSDIKQDLYRALGYADIRDLHDAYRTDFSDARSENRAHDINFYKNNRSEHTNTDILAVIPVTFSETFKATIKPYYSNEDASIYQGVTSQGGVVQKRLRDIERLGVLSRLDTHLDVATLSVGYMFESVDMHINTENYHPTSGAFMGHGIRTENDDNGYVNSPFVSLSGEWQGLDWQMGLKYFRYDEPASAGYTSKSPDFRLIEAPDLARDEKTYDIWLPSLGLSYRINDTLQPYASYGRSHIRPYSYVPIINLYNQNRATFRAAGVTLEDMFSGYEIEISDNFEMGLRITHERFDITPAVFYSLHQNLLTTIHDPRVNLNYQQNIGDATGYGFEIEGNFYATDDVTIFVNPSYTKLTYDDDLTYQGAILEAKNNQVVDTPEWMLKTGVIWKYNNFTVTPTLRYMGTRYGDVEHKEKVDDYITTDLSIAYTTATSFAENLRIGLDLYNVLNTEYVSLINASDDSRSGSATYYVGAPFTAVLSLALAF